MISFLNTNHTLNPLWHFLLQHIPPEPDLPAEGDQLKPDLTVETETENENDETEVTAWFSCSIASSALS